MQSKAGALRLPAGNERAVDLQRPLQLIPVGVHRQAPDKDCPGQADLLAGLVTQMQCRPGLPICCLAWCSSCRLLDCYSLGCICLLGRFRLLGSLNYRGRCRLFGCSILGCIGLLGCWPLLLRLGVLLGICLFGTAPLGVRQVLILQAQQPWSILTSMDVPE